MQIWPICAALIAAIFTWPPTASATENWLIASHTEIINTGQVVSIEAVKPVDVTAWPQTLHLKLSGAGVAEDVTLTAEMATDNDIRRVYKGNIHKSFVGVVHAELAELSSNRLLMLASQDEPTGPVQIAKTTSTEQASQPINAAPTVVIAQPGDEPALSANEPVYFVVGSNDEHDTDARFQLSFKYRPFDPTGSVAEFSPYFSNIYFAYTQTTLWDIGGKSSPFRDTSYRPSLYYRWVGNGDKLLPYEWHAGYEHESNGQGGADSRSVDMAFIQPSWHFDLANGNRLTLLPKFHQYLEKGDNSDIQRYRGYADWQARYGREDGWMVTGMYRQGTAGYSSGQIDVSYPLSDKIFARTGTFVHFQVFSGYGETLLDYNVDHGTQVRLGLSLVR